MSAAAMNAEVVLMCGYVEILGQAHVGARVMVVRKTKRQRDPRELARQALCQPHLVHLYDRDLTTTALALVV